jgi:hypothetical protein
MKKLLFLALLALVVTSSWPTAQRRVEAQFQTGFGAQRAPAIDVDRNGRLYLSMSVATKTAAERTPGSQIFLTISKNGGSTWDNMPLTRNLSKSDGEAFGPSLAVVKTSSARSFIAFHDNKTGTTQSYLLVAKKKAKFKKSKNITPHDGGAFAPRIALDPTEALNLVWGDTGIGRRQVMFSRSTDSGSTFSDAINLSSLDRDGFEPEIAISSDSSDIGFAINVVWEDGGLGQTAIGFRRSTDGGVTFSPVQQLFAGLGSSTEPHIAVDSSNRIHIVWIDEGSANAQAFYSRSTDDGATFSAPVALSNSGGDIRKPFVTTFHDNVYVAYNDDSSRSRQVFLLTSEDGGESFGEPFRVSNADPSRGRAHSAAMVADPEGTLHIVWIDSSIIGNDEGLLFYGNTTNGRRLNSQKMILAFLAGPGG